MWSGGVEMLRVFLQNVCYIPPLLAFLKIGHFLEVTWSEVTQQHKYPPGTRGSRTYAHQMPVFPARLQGLGPQT